MIFSRKPIAGRSHPAAESVQVAARPSAPPSRGNQASLRQRARQDATPPAVLGDVLRGGGQPLAPELRADMEQRFGADFADVRLHTDPAADRAAAALGTPAYVWGKDIGFASSANVSTPAGRHMLAHELAHVVQQQRGQTRGLSPGRSGQRARLEQDAEAAARLALTGGTYTAAASAGGAAPALQTFDPDYHETAVIGGAAGVFNPNEIGKIYEANWQRDFSQAAPGFADIVIAWKQLKDAQPADRPPLQQKLYKAVLNVGMPTGETYGGYQTWEHMDNPGGAAAAQQDTAWNGASAGKDIAGYIKESAAYIKENLADAVFHPALYSELSPENKQVVADARSTGKVSSPSPGADAEHAAQPQVPAKANPPNPQSNSAVVAEDVTAIASKSAGAKTASTSGFADDPTTADHIGRASHALEDFFAHSNFIELSQKQSSGERVNPEQLKTGTFGAGDKAHALADKIKAIVADIRAHMSFVAGVLDEGHLQTLERIATVLDGVAGVATGPDSHTALNKDEPSRPNFDMAHKLATAADHLMFQSIQAAMQAAAPEDKRKQVYATYALIDAIINIPSATHPLKSIFAP